MNRSQSADNRLTYVFTYLLRSYLETERRIQDEIQKMGLASIGDVTNNQTLINTIEKDLDLTSKDDQTVNDYFEDHFNLALSNLSQNILPTNNDMTSSNVLTTNNNLINSADHQQLSSFKLPEYDKENLKEDILLKLTQHFDNKVLSLIRNVREAVESNNNPELKVMRERNIELTNQLKEQSKHRDEAIQRLMQTEKNALDYLNQIQEFKDELKNFDALKYENNQLSLQLKQYRTDYRELIKQKEDLAKYSLLFKNNLPELEKKLKSDLEQSKKHIELIERERDEAIEKLSKLKVEKEKEVEENRRLQKELQLQRENFENDIKYAEKQLNDQKKYIEVQTQERENEIDEYTADLEKLKQKLQEKEAKELNLLEKIRQYEDQIEQINEEKQQLEKCYQETSSRLSDEIKKNKQLHNLFEEYERTKEKTEQVEKELRDRLAKLEDDLYSQLKLNETLKRSQFEQSQGIVTSFVDNVCDNVEQLRCSSANPDMLKTSYLDHHSSNQIHETLYNNDKQSDSMYNSSSIDCTFPDAKKLEENNLKLNSFVKNVIQQNKDLNDELNEAKDLNSNLDNKIRYLENEIDKLKENLKEMVVKRNVLEASISSKEVKLNELQMQLKERSSQHNEESTLKQSIESLKKKLREEQEKVKSLNDELNKTNNSLVGKQNHISKLINEIDRMKIEKHKIETERLSLQQNNKRLFDERLRLRQELEDLQNEREDDLEDNSDIKKMFETVLQDKDEEIANLNSHLDEISQKLKDCLSITPADGRKSTNYFTMLDKVISFYQKNSRTNHKIINSNNNHHLDNSLNNSFKNDRQLKNKLESESYDSWSPIESCEDALTSDEMNDDDDICSKLAGIHNNSVEICNLSFHFKNEKGLIKLINEIPEIVTNQKLTKKEINEWQNNFIDCFSSKTIGQLITKNIISLRLTFMDNQSDNIEKQELAKQLDMCRTKLKIESSQLRKCNGNRKALIFQKKYLMNLNRQLTKSPKQSRQTYRRHLPNKFRIAVLAIIAANRIQAMKKRRELIESTEEIDLIDRINQLTSQLTNVLNPTAEKYSSFINSLHPPTSTSNNNKKVPLNHQHNHYPHSHLHDNHQSTNYQTTVENNLNNNNQPTATRVRSSHDRLCQIKSLKDLLDSLGEVYERLVFDKNGLTCSCTS